MMKNILKNILQYIIFIIILLSISSFDTIEKNDQNKTENNTRLFFTNKNIKDGPYIFKENGAYNIEWIYKNRLVERTVFGKNFKVIKRKFGFEINQEWLSPDSVDFVRNYSGVKNLIAVSDIHGQFDLFVKLLQTYKVIDADYNWSYGNGHLVILGDVFDRGPKVTESLWLIFKLEHQAEKSGGKVHYLLGNHEIMILNNDIRYINEKYITTSKLTGKAYTELYSNNTVLGDWLRTKPAMVSINDLLFVHAGISPELLNYHYTVEEINRLFINQIVGKSWNHILQDSTLSFLMGDHGPIWYRGYFEDTTLNETKINNVLDYFKMNHIIVGHTSMPNITSLFHGKIIGIDSSIKYGDYGEVFIYRNGELLRGTLNGGMMKL